MDHVPTNPPETMDHVPTKRPETMDYVPTKLSFHPNTLIAMVTARIGMTEIPGTTRSNPNVPLLGGGIERFIPVLDAFASLAVSSPDGQVVAIAAQHVTGRSTVLTVAENAVLTPGIAEHLQVLVEILKELSENPHGRREYERRLYMAAYLYSGRKIAKRYSKHLKWLEGFEATFITKPGEDEMRLRLVLSALLTVYQALLEVLPALKQNSLYGAKKADLTPLIDVKLWDTGLYLMTNCMEDAEILLGKPDVCNGWAETLQDTHGMKNRTGQIPAPLHRTIEKFTTHHRHIANLVTYALSPEGTADLSYIFRVATKSANTYTREIPLPDAALIPQVVYTYLNSTDAREFEMECARMTTDVETGFRCLMTTQNVPPVKSTVHCECALIESFNTDPPPVDLPIAYIGVSKLSCAACYAWIQAFNSVHARQYQTRGTHGRWYSGWAMPEGSSKDMRAELKRVVGRAYLRWYRSRGVVGDIVLSDSSQANRVPWPVLTLQQRKDVEDEGIRMVHGRIRDRGEAAAARTVGGNH